MSVLERDGVSRSTAGRAALSPRRRRSRRRSAGPVVSSAPGGAAVVALPDGAPVAVELGADRLAWRLDGLEARLRAIGFAAIALGIWTWTLRAEQLSLVWGCGFALLSLCTLHVALRDRGEYAAATSVRLGRFGLAAAVLALLTIETVATFGRNAHGLSIGLAAAAVCAGAAVFDLRVCRATRVHQPLRLLAIGAGEPAGRLAEAFGGERPHGTELVGFLRFGDESEIAARPTLGLLDDLERVVVEHAIDAVVLASPTRRLEVLEQVLAVRGPAPAVIELSDAYERAFGRVPVTEINAAWFLRALALSRRTARVVPKRLIDLVVASLALVLASPLIAAIALAVKLDSAGPVFYRQQRVGEGGREFTMLKFRSMHEDAERDGVRWAAERDPRVTRVGRLLRRFRLDEIPQFWNVLRGEMTVVGPRPERPEMVAMLSALLPFYDSRHLARPGITGWAQVYAPYGASVDDALQKLSYDLYYLNHSSLSTDLGIMLRTAGVMLGGWGAR